MRKRIVFLDVEGVLNTMDFLRSANNPRAIDSRRVQLVKSVFDEITEFDIAVELEIVISSTWRLGQEATWDKEIRQKLASAGWENPPIIGRTPDMDSGRGSEINAWLITNHGESFAEDVVFAIVDDDVFDMLPEQRDAIVECDGEIGFTEHEHDKLLKILMMMTPGEVMDILQAAGRLGDVLVFDVSATPDVQMRQAREIAEFIEREQNRKNEE